MNQQIIDYLAQNKDIYPKESLVQQLRASGYGENDIQEAVSVVYGVEFSPNNIPMPNAPNPQTYAGVPNISPNKTIFIVIAVLLVSVLVFIGIIFMMKKKDSKVSDNIQTLSTIKDAPAIEQKNTAKISEDMTNTDNGKNITADEQNNKSIQTETSISNSDKDRDLKCTWSNGGMTISTYVSGDRLYQEVIPSNERRMYTIQKDDQIFIWYSDRSSGTREKTETNGLFEGLMQNLKQNNYKCEAWVLDEKVFIPPTNINFTDAVK